MSASALIRHGAGFQEDEASDDFLSFSLAGQEFGIPVLLVRDVLAPQRITPVPLAPAEIAGQINLRGRIVTVIDMRRRLSLASRAAGEPSMQVVIECGTELYSLIVDEVGEVLSLPRSCHEPNPVTLEAARREVSNGLYRLDKKLLAVLDVDKVIGGIK
jgi:purine-binding chemotaxis protein CheW